MSTQLEIIVANTRAEVAERRKASNPALLERTAAAHYPRGFEASLRQAAANGAAIIAELKKASPSRGLIRAAFDPPALAKSLESAGAAALSVLTDARFFQGSLDYLRQASEAVTIPCLRKDFIVSDYQLVEAVDLGADAALLIVSALTDVALRALLETCASLGLAALVEVHDQDEAKRALAAGATIVGVNSRNLRTLSVDPSVHEAVVRDLPAETIAVAESGLRTPADLERLAAAGYHAFLVGERLIAQPDPGAALRELRGA